MSRVADLLMAQGHNAAQARADRGGRIGQAISAIGQIPGQVQQQRQERNRYALLQQREARADQAAGQEAEIRGMQIAGAKTAARNQTALDVIWGSGIIQEDGSIDVAKAEQLATQAGMPHLVPVLRKQATEWETSALDLKGKREGAKKATLDLESAQRDHLGVNAASIADSGYDPGTVKLFLAKAAKDGALSPERVNAALTHMDQDPTAAKGIIDAFVARSPSAVKLAGERATAAKTQAEADNLRDTGGPQAETNRHNKKLEEIALMTAGRAEATLAETRRHNRATEANAAAGRADVTDLSPAGLDAAATMFAKTGQLPALGNGDKGTRKAIINRAAELIPGLDVATAKADFASNQDSLRAMQKQRDAIGAFEQTAQKNIDVFLATAGKVVDSGSPYANAVMRNLSGKVLGSPDQAAYEAARQVAINEIAKITSNPTLAGTLSDSARHEIDAFNPHGATLKQTVAVMRLLKRDMQNRTDALDEQLAAIKGRIGKASSAAPTDTGTTPPPAGAPIQVGGFTVTVKP